MPYNTDNTLQSGATSAFNFRMHLLTRKQGKFSLPTRFLIRGDLLELYRENIRGHDGSKMNIGGRTYRFIENPVTGSVLATCEIVKPVLKRRKPRSQKKAKKQTAVRRVIAKKPKAQKVVKRPAIVKNSKASPQRTSTARKIKDHFARCFFSSFSLSRGSISFARFEMFLDSHSCRVSFKEYSSRSNWTSKGLVIRLPGKPDAKLLRATKTGYQYGVIKEVSSKMGFNPYL